MKSLILSSNYRAQMPTDKIHANTLPTSIPIPTSVLTWCMSV